RVDRPEGGETLGGLLTVVEVTEELRRERAIREGEERFRVILSSIGDAVIATDAVGTIGFMNPVAESLTGWEASEARGRPLVEVFQIVNEETREVVDNPAHKVMRDGVVVGLANHTILVGKDQSERAIDDSAAPIRDLDGGIKGVVLVFRDVEERRKSERSLRESQERLRQLADTMPQMVWTAGPNGEVEYFNGRWYEYTGLSAEQSLLFEGWRRVVHPEDMEQVYALRNRAVVEGEHFHVEVRLRDRHGAYRWHIARSVPVYDESGHLTRRFGTATDIDDRVRSEQALRE
ncbi:PAS domain-containing protein, partial [Singulisphaera rosea]